ncbi:ATP-binding protein [Myroides odoratimimus]|uniref:ATP-binding protein n=1 Tax=Myroides odoratimimus TaxID=76832 RepID=UPI002577181B|nr:ATP-binding protein [Myroides odoratimimus]MDM1452491.1 ATP-binding protein [Myroides odoratimimus]MDM1455789.1 ATP-binding protein [Myroides odoratimimus]MDM1476216.1 ATP-binding protein [Myroides odoratimimus]MDM1488743.1 ATP-binding protein [Myroides odoratimimus]
MKINPFQHSHFLGYVNHVSPSFIKIHFPSSILMKSFYHNSEILKGGLVGNYVVIEGEDKGFLCKLLEISLPEKERLELSEKTFSTKEFHPTGRLEVLLSFDLFNPLDIEKGVNSLPLIGSKVFICSSEFLATHFKKFGVKTEDLETAPTIKLGNLIYDKNVPVDLSLQALFGRHCAVVGTTGGGKSYTISKFIEGIIQAKSKAIIIDPTGEYSSFDTDNKVISTKLITDSYFPYQNLTINDLFVLFRPSGQVQQPILLEAIKSLKLATCLLNDIRSNIYSKVEENHIFNFKGKNVIINEGLIIKNGNDVGAFNNAIYKYKEIIEYFSQNHFDISLLHKQISNECYYSDEVKWSGRDTRNFGNATSLIIRINNIIQNEKYNGMFGFNNPQTSNLIFKIEEFLTTPNQNVLRISFEDVPYDFQAREILANALGRYLLNKSRTLVFRDKPLVLFVDEAHQFLNKKVKDEYFESTELSAFDSIAKESRKYGLFLCLATQMPRDIPTGTLSQMGTFIAHRLINHYDKEAISSACSTANKETLAFLPSLGSGEAIIMGGDFPMPLSIKIDRPLIEPKFDTPKF